MFGYPQSFPSDEAKILIGVMDGSAKPSNDAVRCAWALAGYAASQIAPITPSIKGSDGLTRFCLCPPDCPCASKEDAKKHLQALVAHFDHKQGFTLPNIPWDQLFTLFLKSVQEGIQVLIDAN